MKKRILFLAFLLFWCFSVSPVLALEDDAQRVESGLLQDKGATLVGKRRFVIEPAFQYTHISSNRLDIYGFTVLPSLLVGIIDVKEIRRDILTPSLTFRYGVSEQFEANLKIPYIFRYDSYINSAVNSSNDVDDSDIGDIEAGFLVHLLKEKGSFPAIMAGLKVKSRTGKDPYGLETEDLGSGISIPRELPTGSGHWAFEPSLTFVKTIDPAVLFANISYYESLERDTSSSLGKVDPGSSINYSIGFAYALNDKFAISTSFDQKFFSKTDTETEGKLAGSDITIANLNLGATYIVSGSNSVNITVGIGLTEDSPDVQVAIKFPISFIF